MTTEELESILTSASSAYSVGQTIMTDAEYDKLAEDYKSLTGKTWYWEDAEGDIQHSRPMLSLEKAKTVEDIVKFFKQDSKSFALLLPKIDGLALSLVYRNGFLVSALTRGKRVGGVTYGNSVIQNARRIYGIPYKISVTAPIEIRGEVYMPENFFSLANETRAKYKKPLFENVRNAAAGILRTEDGSGLNLLRFVAYNVFNPDQLPHEDSYFGAISLTSSFDLLTQLGFSTPPIQRVDVSKLSLEGLHEFIDNKTLEYQTDGVVVTLESIAAHKSLGTNNSHPLYSVAFKFEDETAETTLLDIEWTATRTGRIVPTYLFEPVRLEGTTVSRATGHNYANIIKLNAKPGDKVEVYKANMIIPQVRRVTAKNNFSKHFDLVNKCPSCLHKVTYNLVDALCENDACSAKIVNQLINACNRKNWDIDGMGESLAYSLVYSGLVKTIPDLFRFTIEKEFQSRLAKTEMSGKTLGASNAKKLVENIQKAKEKPWSITLHALGCPGLGEPECKEIAKRWSLKDLLSCETLTSDLLAVKGFGSRTVEEFTTWLEENKSWIQELNSLGVNTSREESQVLNSDVFSGKTFVITGTHSVPRHVLEKLIQDNGGTLTSAVSKNTDFLVAGENAGSKLEKAESINAKAKKPQDTVTIINEQQLKDMVA